MSDTWKAADLKHQSLRNILKKMGKVAVAFSGGVDSTLLLKVARTVLKHNVLAITAHSDTTPQHEKQAAICLAEEFGVPHIFMQTREMELSRFVENPPDKCYICKKTRFQAMLKLLQEKGVPYLVDGENQDDQDDYRPGSRAARELGIQSPLRDAGLRKMEIRLLARKLNLPNWNAPSSACLASRIPYHTPITPEKLRQVDAGEDFLRSLGLSAQVRVRHYGDTARIESDTKAIARFAENRVRSRVVEHFKSLGFRYVTLDLEGYRMGSLNADIEEPRPSSLMQHGCCVGHFFKSEMTVKRV